MLDKKFSCLVDGVFTDASGYNDAVKKVTNVVGQGKVTKAYIIVEVTAGDQDVRRADEVL